MKIAFVFFVLTVIAIDAMCLWRRVIRRRARMHERSADADRRLAAMRAAASCGCFDPHSHASDAHQHQ